jgi:hypothetical protein
MRELPPRGPLVIQEGEKAAQEELPVRDLVQNVGGRLLLEIDREPRKEDATTADGCSDKR